MSTGGVALGPPHGKPQLIVTSTSVELISDSPELRV